MIERNIADGLENDGFGRNSCAFFFLVLDSKCEEENRWIDVWYSGSGHTVFGPVKEKPVRASSSVGVGSQNPALVLALESLQYKGGKEERMALDTLE